MVMSMSMIMAMTTAIAMSTITSLNVKRIMFILLSVVSVYSSNFVC